MATFVPMTSKDSTLPVVGQAQENVVLDFKVYKDPKLPKSRFDAASEVAAFANTMGGVILLGAAEHNGTLSALPGFPDAVYKDVSDCYDLGVRDLCRPGPRFSSVKIDLEDGNVLMAVNVWPMLDTVIGVRYPGDPAKGYAGSDGFIFYERIGANNMPISAERLPFHMIAELRRIRLLLEEVGEELVLFQFHPRIKDYGTNRYRILAILERENAIVINAPSTHSATMRVQLDDVRSVFKDEDGWHVSMGRSLGR